VVFSSPSFSLSPLGAKPSNSTRRRQLYSTLLPGQIRRGHRRFCVLITHDDWGAEALLNKQYSDLDLKGISRYAAALDTTKVHLTPEKPRDAEEIRVRRYRLYVCWALRKGSSGLSGNAYFSNLSNLSIILLEHGGDANRVAKVKRGTPRW